MVPVPANVRVRFLSWDQPLLGQTVALLAGEWTGAGPLDLSSLLVIVPTAQSGRRLREALARHAARRGQAVFPPTLRTPETFLSAGLETAAASRLQSLLAWTEVLQGIDFTEFREVFPIDPPTRNFAWALRLAGELIRLQSTLAEGGLQIRDVAVAPSGPDNELPEIERWRQLAQLDLLYAEQLRRRGLRDLQEAKIAAAKNPPPLPGLKKIIVLATPDPLPLVLTALASRAGALPVEIAVFAPESEAAAFDGWGCPIAAAWESRPLALPSFEEAVQLCADPEAEADSVAATAAAYGTPVGRLAVGVADPEVLPPLESALTRTGLAPFNPEGRLRRGDGLYHLLETLAALAREPAFATVEVLARCPDFLGFLAHRSGGSFSPARWLRGLDELHERHLPATLEAAQRHAPELGKFPELAPGLDAVAAVRAKLTGGAFPAAAAEALALIFEFRTFDLARETDQREQESGEAWTGIVGECAATVADLALGAWWDLALQLFGDSQRTDDKPPGALELQGWLELLWEEAPHLVVAGFNDGRVPDAVLGDPFLPEALRVRLGLKTNGGRFARDVYLLSALAASRARVGRLDLLVGRFSAAGDPLRPSRLLLRCPDPELPNRVKFLFRPAPPARAAPPWRRAWQLQPPSAPPLRSLRVTAFKDYLRCPFRFYLKHVLKLKAVDPQKSELDAMNFGTLCHGTLDAMARAPGLRDCTDVAVLEGFLLESLRESAGSHFGAEPALPLVIQLRSAAQRLARAAEIQAEERLAGWVIAETEKDFRVKIGGIDVNGKIDRVERREGAVRILDYKTSDTPKSPFAAHCRKAARSGETAPDWARFTVGGKEHIWTDLQLPLYLEALDLPAASCGYFNLPKATGESGIVLWEDYAPDLHAAAMRCATGVSDAIQAGIFWPPAELTGRDEDETFTGFFHQGTAASVDPRFLAAAATAAKETP